MHCHCLPRQVVLRDEWVLTPDYKAIYIARSTDDPSFYSYLTRGAGLPVWYPALGAPDANPPASEAAPVAAAAVPVPATA